MMDSVDLLGVHSGPLFFTIRWYADSNWGWRRLGPRRHCLDLWRFGLVFEKYDI